MRAHTTRGCRKVIEPMRIFHVNSIGGIAPTLCNYANEQGHFSDYITTKRSNKWGHYSKSHVLPKPLLALKLLWVAPRKDIIIVHYDVRALSLISNLYNVFFYAHGSDIRGKFDKVEGALRVAEHIFVSTPDLLEEVGDIPATYIPNPVAPQFFSFMHPVKKRAFTFTYNSDSAARLKAREYNLDLDIIERNIPFKEMPLLFARYTHYIDIKRDKAGRSLINSNKGIFSKTALEALASGLTVITEQGEVTGLPEQHKIEHAGALFLKTLDKYRYPSR